MKQNKRSEVEQNLRKLTSVKQPKGKSALEIFKNFSTKQKDLNRKFYFEDFRKVVDLRIGHADFIQSVFLLAQPSVAFLEQRVEAMDDMGNFKDISLDNVVEMLASRIYVNPITKMALNEQEFSKQIRMYFLVAENFKNKSTTVGG